MVTNAQLDEMQKQTFAEHNGYLRVMLIDHPCLAKMEAAMRAMEPFIVNEFVKPESFFMGWTELAIQQFTRANAQWESTQRECWREP